MVNKIIYVFLFSFLFTVVRCQTTGSISKIEFSTATRGFQKQIFISPDSITEIVDGRKESNVVKRKLTADQWNSLLQDLQDITLNEVPSFPSPTSKRNFDGAHHSTLTITAQDGKTWQHSFDDEAPHEKLKPLMGSILKIEKEVRK
jgi:hypothetical protein